MKAIIALSVASFLLASGNELYAPVVVCTGLLSYLWFERLKISPRRRQELDNCVIILLFIGICAFVWFCTYRIYVKGLLF